MNKDYIEQYKVGDLVTIQDTSYFGMVVGKRPDLNSTAIGTCHIYMYKLHFCGEEEPDGRWMFEDALKRV